MLAEVARRRAISPKGRTSAVFELASARMTPEVRDKLVHDLPRWLGSSSPRNGTVLAEVRLMKLQCVRRILVPTDFDPGSRLALDWAITLGRRFDSAIRVFHAGVVPPVTYAEFVTWPIAPIEEAARRAMNTLVSRASKDYPGIEGGVRVGIGAAYEILAEVETWKPDLVVMSTHGRRGIERFFMGSVAENVLRHSQAPVFVVRPPETKE